jgi:hypothetical protein
MSNEVKHDYRYLDSEEDRRALLADIHQVREDVIKIARLVPESRWYEPRYHGWSLAAMLGHLQTTDRLSMWLMKAALLGIRLPIPTDMLNRFNDGTARVYKGRVLPTTIQGIQNYEKHIADFILKLPVDRFSRMVHDPALGKTVTIEQAVQEFYLFHWQEHLATLRGAEDVFYEPPGEGSSIL